MSVWASWRTSRLIQRGAERYTAAAWEEPSADAVSWLAREVAAGDEDHARWELRYLRRAVAQLVAERDGWDDRTGAAVATCIADRLRHDPDVATERMAVAQRQFDQRLSRYREALRERGGGSLARRLATEMLQVTAPGRPVLGGEERLSELVAVELERSGLELRESFGLPELPDDVKPSEVVRRD